MKKTYKILTCHAAPSEDILNPMPSLRQVSHVVTVHKRNKGLAHFRKRK